MPSRGVIPCPPILDCWPESRLCSQGALLKGLLTGGLCPGLAPPPQDEAESCRGTGVQAAFGGTRRGSAARWLAVPNAGRWLEGLPPRALGCGHRTSMHRIYKHSSEQDGDVHEIFTSCGDAGQV